MHSDSMVVPIRVPFMGQIDLVKNICVCYDCAQKRSQKKHLHKKCR